MKKIILVLSIVLYSFSSNACEICGCGMGNYYIGLMPQFSHRFFGLRYQFSSYSTHMANDPTQFSKDFYQTVELWSGWNIGKRWQVLAFLPYNFNHQNSDDGISSSNGFGDIALIGNYKVFNKISKTGNNKMLSQQLWLGAGVKLPTGKFHIDPNDADIAAAANTQIGSGSTDVMLNAMYDIHIDKLGISANVNYKINTDNTDAYRFGNRLSANSFIFYSIPVSSLKTVITPNFGLLFQNSAANKLQNAKVDLTGGNLLMAAPGFEMSFNKMTIGMNTQLPVAQNFAEGQTKTKVKGMLHVTFDL
ncbi:MAG TPA: transporter [Chitinophagaceae bacterium]|nr:transporter [Chitinophagaceae bacterium]